MGKYGKKYDLTIARRSFAGKDFVSLNVMWYALFIPAHHSNHNLTTFFVVRCPCLISDGTSDAVVRVHRVHVDQRSFPMSLEQYMDKMDGISVLMNAWSRQAQVLFGNA